MMLGIYGTGGLGRELFPVVRQNYPSATVFFIDDNVVDHKSLVNGIRVISLENAANSKLSVIVAVGDPKLRKLLAEKCTAAGLGFFSTRANDVEIYDDVTIGEGAVFCARSMVTSNVRIGRHFQGNIYSYIAHDCVIGDFVTFAPGVHCNGRVKIGDGAYLGTGAVLKQGEPNKPLVIGEGATVGMGAVVTKDVAPFSTVVGNPARPLVKRS